MSDDERARLEHLRGRVEDGLRRCGGDELLDDARVEAEWYVADFFDWNRRDREPVERLRARVQVLLDRLTRAAG